MAIVKIVPLEPLMAQVAEKHFHPRIRSEIWPTIQTLID